MKKQQARILFSENLRDEFHLTRSSVYRYMRLAGFPAPFKMGNGPRGRVAWHRDEIEEWFSTRPRVELPPMAGEVE